MRRFNIVCQRPSSRVPHIERSVVSIQRVTIYQTIKMPKLHKRLFKNPPGLKQNASVPGGFFTKKSKFSSQGLSKLWGCRYIKCQRKMQPFITKCCVQKNRFDGKVYMLRLSVSTEEYLLIGDNIKIAFLGGSHNHMRIMIDAPKEGSKAG